jgi:hypothetical protein
MRNRNHRVSILLFILALVATAQAQWSSDPLANLPLADKPNNDQVQPKLRPLSNNGWYVSWFDSDPSDPPPVGYDVYYQRLSPSGVEQFPHDGRRVAKLTNSSTQDYGLDADREGNALLAFLDTREDPNQQVTAARMSPQGKRLWGDLGVQLTADSSFHAAPKITGTSDDAIVVGWTSDSSVVLQRLNSAGQPQWGSGIVVSASGFNYSLSGLRAADNGSVIASWVRDKGFGSNRNILAMKYSSDGTPLWGANPVVVFDGGSLQFGNFPGFIPDGSGGAVFGWYSSSPSLQCYAQHILANGTEAFPHNGSVASTNSANARVSPSVSYRPETSETFLFWTEEDSQQIVNGVYGQKFDVAGNRARGQFCHIIVPLGADQQIFVSSVHVGSGALVFWVDEPGFDFATIQAIRLDQDANSVCQQFPVSSVFAGKSGLAASITPVGEAALAWQDDRSGNSDIFIQNVNPDCSLGLPVTVAAGRSTPR